jgi:hypothetical protein
MDKKPLTLRQRQILFLMREADGPTMITGGTRQFLWGKLDGDHPGALLIQAYMEPDLWLHRRGLIEIVAMNVPGRWYRLTEDGLRRANTIERMP